MKKNCNIRINKFYRKNLINIIKKDKKNFEIVLLSADKNYKDLLNQAKIF